jgi:hypothetical protein
MAVVLQYRGPIDGIPARSLIGNSGTVYVVNSLGQATVSDADAPYLVADGWAPVVPGSGVNYATVNFGAFPGSNFASVTIPDAIAGTDTNALIDVRVVPVATVDHTADEHSIDGPIVSAYGDGNGNIIINAYPNNNVPNVDSMMPWGKWTVAWSYMQ